MLLSKLGEDADTGQPKRIDRFPQEMLNSRDPLTGKGVDGLINLDMAEAIDEILGREKKMESGAPDLPTAQNIYGSPRLTAKILSSEPPVRADAPPEEKNFRPLTSYTTRHSKTAQKWLRTTAQPAKGC